MVGWLEGGGEKAGEEEVKDDVKMEGKEEDEDGMVPRGEVVGCCREEMRGTERMEKEEKYAE